MSNIRDVFDEKIGSKILRMWRHMSSLVIFCGLSDIFVGVSLSVQANSCVDG